MTALALAALLVWLVLLFGRGGFWLVEPDMLPGDAAYEAERLPRSVLAIVPARNEADTIGRTLPSLLAQRLHGRFHVLLVDDLSEDGTAEAAIGSAGQSGKADSLTVLEGDPLPSGWAGKVWAMQQGFTWAGRQTSPPDLILFTDADIVYTPGVLDRLVAQAQRRGTVLTSLMVELRAKSVAERWLVPAFVYFFKMLYPFAWVSDPAKRTAAAAGGSMLVDRNALEAAGGLGSIRDALIDDCALGRLMKGRGPIWLGLTRDVRSVRAYPRVADIRRMVVRSAYAELRYRPWRLVVALCGLALVFAAPPFAALVGSGVARVAGIAAWLLMAASFVPMLRFYRAHLWTGLLLPVIAMLYAGFTLESAIRHWQGQGGVWKGRVQAQAGGRAVR